MDLGDVDDTRESTTGRTTAEALARGARRRAFGVAWLHAWRSLGKLLARTDHDDRFSTATLEGAIARLDALRATLLAMRDASDGDRR